MACSLLAAGLMLPASGEARVVKLVVEQRGAYVGGASWGNAGPYEMLRGTAYLEADPRNPHDAVIVDLEHAPRNARRMVEYSTQFMILKPVDMSRGNRKIFHAVNNRGNSLEGLLAATTAAQVSGTDAGYAMSEGYTVIDAGWEGDVIPAATKLVATVPVASNHDGSPIMANSLANLVGRIEIKSTTN